MRGAGARDQDRGRRHGGQVQVHVAGHAGPVSNTQHSAAAKYDATPLQEEQEEGGGHGGGAAEQRGAA